MVRAGLQERPTAMVRGTLRWKAWRKKAEHETEPQVLLVNMSLQRPAKPGAA